MEHQKEPRRVRTPFEDEEAPKPRASFKSRREPKTRTPFEGETESTVDNKTWLVLLCCGIFGLLASAAMFFYAFKSQEIIADFTYPEVPSKTAETNRYYSVLTGLEISDPSLNNSPTFCVQVPNGTDGARPQAGLDDAGVIFEAIAEAGITRFAAIYQNQTSAVIGPIRSLRMYYLQWDTPFNCTVVHAGGADDALAALKSGGYRDLTENYTYMYRSSAGNRLWNNLFTTASYLNAFNNDRGYTSSNVTGFTRLTPAEAETARIATQATKLDIVQPSASDTSLLTPAVSSVYLNYGNWASFNVTYQYDVTTNSYNRAYQSGTAHQTYHCPADLGYEPIPEYSCTLTQLSPKVVIAMMVEEQKAWDNYHEDITAIGSGKVYIFQNGTAIEGTWIKPSVAEQIKFYDTNNQEIKLVPGQTWVSAVPNYGSVTFE